MVIEIHKAIILNPISKNLLKPWASNADSKFFKIKII